MRALLPQCMQDKTLETKRLNLRPFKISDAERLAKLLNNINVSYMCSSIPYPYTLQAAEAWLCMREAEPHELTWAIENKEDGQLIGGISISNENKGQAEELGYWLSEELWGKGFMTEAAKQVIEYSFKTLKHQSIIAKVFDDNPASQRILEKLKFQMMGPTTCTILNETPGRTMSLFELKAKDFI